MPAAGNAWWLPAVAAAFTAAELLFASRRLGLSWDEVVYVSQVSGHAPAAFFDAARARGISLLAGPVTLLTSSVGALRVYLSVASGLALLLALAAWRPLRPAWTLALAGMLFGGLWVAQYYGPQAMPDEWVAFSSLAAVGLFLRAAGPARPRPAGGPHPGSSELATSRRWPQLAGLAASIAFAGLFRPGDALFLAAALFAAAAAVRPWRRWPLLAAVIAGLACGTAEWAIEAYVRFGGPLARLHAASHEQGGFGLRPGWWAELRALNGPTLCRPCKIGFRYPGLSLWWLALPVLAALGVLAARYGGRAASSLLAASCGGWIAVPYLFLIGYAAPRFLLPAYALLAIPVADLLAWLIAGVRRDLMPVTAAAVTVGIAAQLAVQHAVLAHEVAGTVLYHRDYARIAADLGRLGIRPPCLIKGAQHIPIAFYAGCASAPSAAGWRTGGAGAGRIAVLEFRRSRPPGYAVQWRRRSLTGTRVLKLVGYVSPASRGH